MRISKIIKLFVLIAIISFAIPRFTQRKKLLVKINTESEKKNISENDGKASKREEKNKSLVKFKDENIQSKVENISPVNSAKDKINPNKLLNQRQEDILQIIKTLGQIDMPKLASVFKKVTDRTLRRDLLKLSKIKLIEKVGDTKGASYKAS